MELKFAVANFHSAISLKPDYADAYLNLGIAQNRLGELQESLRCFDVALNLNPDYQFIPGTRMHLKMQMCQWENFDHEVNALGTQIIAKHKVTPTLPLLAMIDSPKLQYDAACIWGQHHNPENSTLGNIARHPRGKKIRIAYFSTDFYYHAVSILMAGVFEAHDRDSFEIYAFSLQKASDDDEQHTDANIDWTNSPPLDYMGDKVKYFGYRDKTDAAKLAVSPKPASPKVGETPATIRSHNEPVASVATSGSGVQTTSQPVLADAHSGENSSQTPANKSNNTLSSKDAGTNGQHAPQL